MRNSHFIAEFCNIALFLWMGLVSPTTLATQSLDDDELRVLGAKSTLQIKTTWGDNKHSYGSALAWKETTEHLIIATAYHVLKGANTFEILAPHKNKNFAISSSKFEVYVEPAYDLVLLRLNLADTPDWLSPVTTCESPENKSGRAFGFPGFYENRSNIYDPEVTLGRDDLSGGDISMKYLKNTANMEILHLTLDPTAKGMSGGPVLDEKGCFRGIVIGRLPDILGIAISYGNVQSRYRVANHQEKFKRFDSSHFKEETVFSDLAIQHFSSDDEAVVNDVSWWNAKNWGELFDDASVFRRQFQDIRINLEHYRQKDETNTLLKLRKIGYERGEVSLLINGEKVEVPPQWKEVDLSSYLCPGQNQILITQNLRKKRHQVFLNDFLRSNRLNLALELGDRRIYRIGRELPAILSNNYLLILYLYVDKLPKENNNNCHQLQKTDNRTKNGQFAIRLQSLHKKLYSTAVHLPLKLSRQEEAKKIDYNFKGCLQVGTKEAIQKNNPTIDMNKIIGDRSRCSSVCVNKDFHYVDFGLFGTLKIDEANIGFDSYKASLVDRTTTNNDKASCSQTGSPLDSNEGFSFPLHYGVRLELLNDRHEKSGWMLRGTNADFLENSALAYLGCNANFFSDDMDIFLDITPYLPNVLTLLWADKYLPRRELQAFDEKYFKDILEWMTEESSDNQAKLLNSTTVHLDSYNEDDWLLIDVQIGDVQINQDGSNPTFTPVLKSEFVSKYPDADVFVELNQIKTNFTALGDLIPELPKLGFKGLLNLSDLKIALTLPENLAATGVEYDYCNKNSDEIYHIREVYEDIIVKLFKRPDVDMAFTLDSQLNDGPLFNNKAGMDITGGYIKGEGSARLTRVKTGTKTSSNVSLTLKNVEISADIFKFPFSQTELVLEKTELSLSELKLSGGKTQPLKGEIRGSIDKGIIKWGKHRVKVPQTFEIDFDEQRQEFIKIELQNDIPLSLDLPQGEFKLNLQPMQLFISETGAVSINTDIKPTTITGSQPKPQAASALPEPERSFLALPVRIPVSTVKEIADRELPTEFRQNNINHDCPFGNCTMNLLVKRRGNIALEVLGQKINSRIPLSVDVDWWKKLAFNARISHHADADIDVNVNSPLELNKNWQIESKVQLNSQINRANLGNLGTIIRLLNKLGAKIDIHREIEKLLQPQLNSLGTRIDSELSKFDVKKEVLSIWKDLQKPRKLINDPPLWLHSQLDQVYFGGLHGNGEEIKLDLAVSGKLYGQMDSHPSVMLKKPLPPLTLQAYPNKNFDINLYLTVKLEELKLQLESRLKKEWIEIAKGVDAKLELQNAYGNGNKLVVQIGFTAFHQNTALIEGNLSLSGQPIWNDSQKQLEVKQFEIVLDNTVDSNNAVLLKQLAASSGLKDSLIFPLAKEVEQAKQELEQALNRKLDDTEIGSFYLQGQVDTLGIQDVYVQKEQVLILLNATGQMEIVK